MVAGIKGHSTNRPPLFNGSNYQFWSNCISIFMRSYDYKMWDVVLDGAYVPMKKNEGNEESKPKLQSEWTKVEVMKVQVNFKAINTLHCVLNLIEFNRISTCKTAKEICDKLKVIHNGTTQGNESEITLLSN